MNNIYKITLLSLLSAISFTGCAYNSSTQKGVVGVDRKQIMLVSSQDMSKGADEAYSSVIAKAKKDGTLNKNKKNTQRVQTIAKRLIAQVQIFRPEATAWQWEANLLTSAELNAWCMPGGKIAFYSGIIEKLKLTDNEIAAIMGHEMAHALREHSRERSSQSAITGTLLSLGSSYFKLGETTSMLANKVANVAIALPNSREQESEADYMGVELAARAGYNPKAAISVWQKMKKVSSNQPPEFLSTHPSHDTRIEELKSYTKVVYPLYMKAIKRTK